MTNEQKIKTLEHILEVANRSDCGIKEIDAFDEEAIQAGIEALKATDKEPAWIMNDNGEGIAFKNIDVNKAIKILEILGEDSVITQNPMPDKTVSEEVFKQIMWERDIAIKQLEELGYGLGEKIDTISDKIKLAQIKEEIESSKKYVDWGFENPKTIDNKRVVNLDNIFAILDRG